MMYFRDRAHAGQELAKALSDYHEKPNTLLLALPRGGVSVAYEISRKLNLPLDVLLVRKLGVPGHEEYAMGAIAEDDIIYINQDVVDKLRIPKSMIDNVIKRETSELNRRRLHYRQDRPAPSLEGKTIIIVDDGLATGATMQVALKALREAKISRLIVAVPVCAASRCELLEEIADEVLCLYKPYPFDGVGKWYKDFSQVSDQEVKDILMRADTQST